MVVSGGVSHCGQGDREAQAVGTLLRLPTVGHCDPLGSVHRVGTFQPEAGKEGSRVQNNIDISRGPSDGSIAHHGSIGPSRNFHEVVLKPRKPRLSLRKTEKTKAVEHPAVVIELQEYESEKREYGAETASEKEG